LADLLNFFDSITKLIIAYFYILLYGVTKFITRASLVLMLFENEKPDNIIELLQQPVSVGIAFKGFLASLNKDRVIRSVSGDSGNGGFIFMLEKLRYLSGHPEHDEFDDIKKFEKLVTKINDPKSRSRLVKDLKDYKGNFINLVHRLFRVSFEEFHVGDCANAPFGSGKDREEVYKLSNNLAAECSSRHTYNPYYTTIACNTASAALVSKDNADLQEKKYVELREKLDSGRIWLIPKDSAEFLLKKANRLKNFRVENKDDEMDVLFIPYLATPFTVNERIYEKFIYEDRRVEKKKGSSYYRYQEVVRDGKNSFQIDQKFKVFSKAPEELVNLIEADPDNKELFEAATGKANINKEDAIRLITRKYIDELVTEMKLEKQAHLNKKKGVHKDISEIELKVPAVGLFCTHYPIVRKAITEAFEANGISNVELIAQGEVAANKYKNDIIDGIDSGLIKARSPMERLFRETFDVANPLKISSITTAYETSQKILMNILKEFSMLGDDKSVRKKGNNRASIDTIINMYGAVAQEPIKTKSEHSSFVGKLVSKLAGSVSINIKSF
jgi:glutamate racemase